MKDFDAATRKAGEAIARAFNASPSEQMAAAHAARVKAGLEPWWEGDGVATWMATTVWLRRHAAEVPSHELAGLILLALPLGLCVDVTLAPLRMLGRRA